MRRRHFLAASTIPLLGCEARHTIQGEFVGVSLDRGHLVRDRRPLTFRAATQRTRVLILGGGVAGLAAARALRLRGMQDFAVLELEDQAGGNSRSLQLGGIDGPMGAHYLPVPGDNVPHVQDLMEELGLRQRVSGRWVANERHLCHSPQERLFFRGTWQEGLLPLHDVSHQTLAQYRLFASRVDALDRSSRWVIPVSGQPASIEQLQLDAVTFDHWLESQGLTDLHLRWYLDYCCRDDYGARPVAVSAWAGIHYFASRHGFRVPGDGHGDSEGVFTWPQGNAWLTQRMAAPLAQRLVTSQVVWRIETTRSGVEVDVLNVASGQGQRWRADRCIVALPALVAARVVQNPPPWLRERATGITYAPWVTANVHLSSPLQDRVGAPLSWDNVLHDTSPTASLGYVNAAHQSLHPVPGPTVLTWYFAAGLAHDTRRNLFAQPWAYWRDAMLSDLSRAHPDLADKATHMTVTRYGHAMPVPVPGSLSQLQPRFAPQGLLAGRLVFAHGDWAGYSVFEEAFTLGHLAGQAALAT